LSRSSSASPARQPDTPAKSRLPGLFRGLYFGVFAADQMPDNAEPHAAKR
jgi:hypothetical protein